MPAAPADIQGWLAERHPELRVMSVGERIEIYKEAVDPRDFVERFGLADVAASHALGHTRMATESRVTTEHSHPFSTGLDLCLVHNGSLSNHNRLRAFLRRQGIEFQTDNDTEVAAGYLTWRLYEGDDLEQALTRLPRRPRRLLHLRRRHGRRLRRPPRPDRLQAGGARRDRRLGRDGLRVPGDRRPARRRRGGALGAGAGPRLLMAARDGGVSVADPGVESVDLAITSVRELNQRLHDLEAGGSQWRISNPNGAHALAVGLDAEVEVEIDGHVGYYCAGMNKLATVRDRGQRRGRGGREHHVRAR